MKRLLILVLVCFGVFASELPLNITYRQSVCIDTIIYSLGEKSTGSLMFNAFQLRSFGKEIDPVPPLEFLYYVCTKPTVFQYLKDTRGRYFQWNAFISGFGDRCNREDVYMKIQDDLDLFADGLDIDVDALLPYISARDWNGFVNYLITRS